MTGAHHLSRAEVRSAAHLLLETWERLGRSHTLIGGGCSCGAGGIVLGLADFEQDIGDYLRREGEQHQRRDVLAVLDQNAREGDRWSVERLLSRLGEPDASVDPAAATFVMERLTRTVQSFETLHRGR